MHIGFNLIKSKWIKVTWSMTILFNNFLSNFAVFIMSPATDSFSSQKCPLPFRYCLNTFSFFITCVILVPAEGVQPVFMRKHFIERSKKHRLERGEWIREEYTCNKACTKSATTVNKQFLSCGEILVTGKKSKLQHYPS